MGTPASWARSTTLVLRRSSTAARREYAAGTPAWAPSRIACCLLWSITWISFLVGRSRIHHDDHGGYCHTEQACAEGGALRPGWATTESAAVCRQRQRREQGD